MRGHLLQAVPRTPSTVGNDGDRQCSLCRRQRDDESGAAARARFHGNRTVAALNDTGDNGQPESGSTGIDGFI